MGLTYFGSDGSSGTGASPFVSSSLYDSGNSSLVKYELGAYTRVLSLIWPRPGEAPCTGCPASEAPVCVATSVWCVPSAKACTSASSTHLTMPVRSSERRSAPDSANPPRGCSEAWGAVSPGGRA